MNRDALAVYAEPLAAGRRVVVFGDSDGAVAERLRDLGARAVAGVAPGDEPMELRSSSFDLALVVDLGLFEDPERLVALARRLVGEGGAALVCAANRDADQGAAKGSRAFDYYELFDLVAREFADVRMIAQLPFHGIALAELGLEDEAPAVSVDTQLVAQARAPDAFVALASQRGAALDPYAIVELPPPEPGESAGGALDALEAARAELAEATLRADAIEAEMASLEAAAARSPALDRQVEEAVRRAERAESELARVEPELARLAEAHAAELGRYEEALRDRAQAIRLLEVEAARREQMVRELAGALEEQAVRHPPAPPPEAADGELTLGEENARLRARLDALALQLARREADAQAVAWSIEELGRKASAPSPAPEGTGSGGQLTAALDELDALRRALAQEHEQRVRAEAALGRTKP